MADRLQVFVNKCLRRILNQYTLARQNCKQRIVGKTGQEPVLDQIRRMKWNWLGHTLRRNDDSITKQALQWTPQGHRGRWRPRNTWRRDLEKETWTAGYKYSWRKMEAAAQDRASGVWSMFYWEGQGMSQVHVSHTTIIRFKVSADEKQT